jgi:hypothetical protein
MRCKHRCKCSKWKTRAKPSLFIERLFLSSEVL